jgi:uncharacterized protein (DUF3820 family)
MSHGLQPDPDVLRSLVTTRMPFGKHKDWLLSDLPVHYLEWFARQGFPVGKLGMQLETVLVIKANGLESILQKVKRLPNVY